MKIILCLMALVALARADDKTVLNTDTPWVVPANQTEPPNDHE